MEAAYIRGPLSTGKEDGKGGGGTGQAILEGPPVHAASWQDSAAKVMKFYGAAKALDAAGKPTGLSLNPEDALKAALSGAAAGAVIPPPGVGAAVGAALAVVVYAVRWLTGNRPDARWESAGNGVRAWYTHFGPIAFLDWVRAYNAGSLADVQSTVRTFAAWALEKYSIVFTPGLAFYSGIDERIYIHTMVNWSHGPGWGGAFDAATLDQYRNPSQARIDAGLAWLEQFYFDCGVDMRATQELRRSGGRGLMLINKSVAGVTGVNDAADAIEAAKDEERNEGIAAGVGLAAIIAGAMSKA